MGKVGFWAARRDLCRIRTADTAQLAALIDKHGAMSEDLVVVELMDRLRVRIADAKDVAAAAKVAHRKADPVKERRHCDTKLAAAARRCPTPSSVGTRKLFRSWVGWCCYRRRDLDLGAALCLGRGWDCSQMVPLPDSVASHAPSPAKAIVVGPPASLAS